MDPVTISLIAMTCSILIAATNITMCTLQSFKAVTSSTQEHNLADLHGGESHEHNNHLVELTGKESHPE